MLDTKALVLLLLWIFLNQQTRYAEAFHAITPFDGRKHDLAFFHNFTQYLHNINRYNSFIIFAPTKARARYRAGYVNARPLEQLLLEDFNVPVITWGMQKRAKLRHNIGLNNLVFVQFNNLTDPILDVVDYTLDGLHFISILFIYLNDNLKSPTANDIEAFFEWCWSKNMLNVALAFNSITPHLNNDNTTNYVEKTQVYNYSPFPKLTVYNLTKQAENGEVRFIVDRLKDVKRYIFKTPIMTNLPYTLLLNETKNCRFFGICKTKLSGIAGRPYNEYINRINGKVQIEYVHIKKEFDYREILDYSAARKYVHIGVSPVTTAMSFYNATEGSYPIMQSNACIIVPLQKHMHYGHYYRCTFKVKVRLLIVMTFLSLAILYGCEDKNIGSGTMKALRICMGQVSVKSVQRKQKFFDPFLHALVLMMILILAHTYTASMTSMLTSALMHKPIDTVKDFLATDLEILASGTEYELFFKTNMLPTALLPRLRIVNKPYLNAHRRFLNTSYAYIFRSDFWEMGLYIQKRLQRPLFRMPSKELCTPKFYLQLPVQWDSPFLLDLNLFFMQIQESGLTSKWRDMTHFEAAQMKLIDFKKPQEMPWRPLTMHDFTAAKDFYFFLSYLCIFIFFMELGFYHCSSTAKRQHLKKQIRLTVKGILKKFFLLRCKLQSGRNNFGK